jgi:rubrerythrin
VESGEESPLQDQNRQPVPPKKVYLCDRCGCEMVERNCKVTCPNCGNRFDCSDLNIYFD